MCIRDRYCYDKNGDAYTNVFCSSNGKEYFVGDDGDVYYCGDEDDGHAKKLSLIHI